MTGPTRDSPRILGTRTPVSDFLEEFWGKTPKFFPGALPTFVSPVSPEELAGLACDEGIESRIVTHSCDTDRRGKTVRNPYRLLHGPFSEATFSQLGDEAWTLLVQDVDKFVPEVHTLLELVNFLPRWSIDDIMISYAVKGGSVGPHTDRYDVFLLQAQGTRRWQMSTKVNETSLRPDTDLRVLAEFEPEEEFIARPGDVLYLPPGVAHYGVAEDECMTYSFGFRAPTEAALLSHFGDEMVALGGDAQLTEPLLGELESPARLSPQLLQQARSMVRARFEALMKNERSLGRCLTMPKPHLEPETPEGEWTEARIFEQLAGGATLVRNIASRFLYSEECGEIVLFVDGQDFSLGETKNARELAVRLCEGAPIDASAQSDLDGTSIDWALVTELVKRGALIVESPLGG